MKNVTVILLIAATIAGLASCKKNEVPPLPGEAVSDVSSIKIKEVIEPGLPNPNYSFSYTPGGFLEGMNFADSLFMFKVSYKNRRVDKVTNSVNGDLLQYFYQQTNVHFISVHNKEGIKKAAYTFQYDNNKRLIQLACFKQTAAGDSFCYRKVDLDYYADGNLKIYTDYRRNNEQLTLTSIHRFSNYDDGVNVESISLLKDYFDNILYLPQVKFQLNNAAVEEVTGNDSDYMLNSQYNYQNGLPISKTGTLTVTRGTGTGSSFAFSIAYNYY